jgi:hypothetical protein
VGSPICFEFLWVQRLDLHFNYDWLKSKDQISSMESLHSFQVKDAAALSSWLDFVLNNLFLSFAQLS